MCVWMWCTISMNDIIMYWRNSLCMLLRNYRREKTLGEMWAAVIKTINNLLWMAWLWMRAPPNGDRARASRCSEGDHEGHIHEVPQEEHSPSMYIAQIMCKLQGGISTNCQPYREHCHEHCRRINIPKKSQWLRYWCMRKLTRNNKHLPLTFSHVQLRREMCHVITGVYFSAD